MAGSDKTVDVSAPAFCGSPSPLDDPVGVDVGDADQVALFFLCMMSTASAREFRLLGGDYSFGVVIVQLWLVTPHNEK